MIFRILLTAAILAFGSFDSNAKIIPVEVEELMFAGKIDLAKEKIEFALSNSNIKIGDKANLFHALGDIARLEGDIDEAMTNWGKAAELRAKTYKNQKDYHHAWKYAHLSNYYYQKYKPRLAGIYADSCLALIQNLSIEQQKELEIYKIWNITAQSIKQQALLHDDVGFFRIYHQVNGIYLQSMDFQLKNDTHPYYLAKTYHLMANMSLDIAIRHKDMNDWDKALLAKNQAIHFYDKTTAIWKELFGETHFELGKTLFLKGLLYFYLKRLDNNYLILANTEFEKAFQAFGLASNSDDIQLDNIPNKEDLLMFFKYYTDNLLLMHELNMNSLSSLEKAKEINEFAIKAWEQIHRSYNGSNVNQNLAIYGLVPHLERINIIRRMYPESEPKAIDEIFRANQKLKYYDLFKNSATQSELSIAEIQKKLRENQVFLDFHYNALSGELLLTTIRKDKCHLISIEGSILATIQEFRASIVEMNYSLFVQSARQLYDKFIGHIQDEFDEIIICTEGITNDIPFEALLCSLKNVQLNDYRKLDYLLLNKSVRYVITPQSFTNDVTLLKWNLAVYTPSFKHYGYVDLPFSHVLGANLSNNHKAQWFDGIKATLASFTNNNCDMVHISSHALIEEDATSNRIVFSDKELFQSELNALKNIPSFVVVNSCNSGKGKNLVGDGTDGFVRAFHKLGVLTTVANIWEVDDKVSNALLGYFYEEMGAGLSSDAAMRKAKLAQIQNAASSELGAPYYWAGHKVVGNLTFNKAKDSNIGYVFWILSVLGILILLMLLKSEFLY